MKSTVMFWKTKLTTLPWWNWLLFRCNKKVKSTRKKKEGFWTSTFWNGEMTSRYIRNIKTCRDYLAPIFEELFSNLFQRKQWFIFQEEFKYNTCHHVYLYYPSYYSFLTFINFTLFRKCWPLGNDFFYHLLIWLSI